MSDFELERSTTPDPQEPRTGVAGVFLIIAGALGLLCGVIPRMAGPSFAEGFLEEIRTPEGAAELRTLLDSLELPQEEREQAEANMRQFWTEVRDGTRQYPFLLMLTQLVLAGLTLLGGIGMLLRSWWPVCVLGAGISLLPCMGPCCGLFFPIGIWSLVLLHRPGTRAAFL